MRGVRETVVLIVLLLFLPGVAPALAAAPGWAGEVQGVYDEREPGEGFGSAATTVGDVNGDGRSDLAIGASAAGRVYVYYGTEEGYPAEPDAILLAPAPGTSFGAALAPTGDVNGDGYDDMLVGAPAGAGALYLYCGGEEGIGLAPCWQAVGTDPAGALGQAVAWAGDLDGDGYVDLLAGEPGWNGGLGRVLAWRGGPDGPAAAPDWTMEGMSPGERLGSSVAGGIDVTGDDWPDVLAGAPGYSEGMTERGRAFLYEGGPGGPSNVASWEVRGAAQLEHAGEAVALPGDMNGDGEGDLAIGVPDRDLDGTPSVGSVLVFAGGEEDPGEEPTWELRGDSGQAARFGHTLAAAGDVNGDGLADLVVGVPGAAGGYGAFVIAFGSVDDDPILEEIASDAANLGLGNAVGSAGDPEGDGYVAIVGAGPGGAGTAPRVVLARGGRRQLATDEPDWIYYGGQYRAEYGYPVAAAGDVNGDGFDDLLVGDFMWDGDAGEDCGKVELFLGRGGAPADWTWHDWRFEGDQAVVQLGLSIASAGDVNGDGYDDILVAAWKERVNHANEGVVYLFYGRYPAPGDSPDWSFAGGQYDARLGLSVAGIGDVNGDGYADFAMTSPNYHNDSGGEGKLFVFYGGPEGPGDHPDWTWEPTWSGTWFGTMVGRAGDVDGDGYDDLFVTDMNYTNGEQEEGLVMVFHGGPEGLPSDPSWSFEEDREWICLGYSAAGAGDVNGDGYDDLLVSGAGEWENHPEPDEQVVHVFHGGPDGLETSPAWTRYGYEKDGDYGSDVSSAGDVNGDGYGDVLIGADWYSARGLDSEGRVDVHLGGPGGLRQEPAWSWFGGQQRAELGVSCRLAGDVDGDGLPDVAIGAQYLERDHEEEGAALVFLGDRGGPAWLPRQLEPDSERIVPYLSRPRSTEAFRVRLAVRHPFGRARFRTVAETRPAPGDGGAVREETPWEEGDGTAGDDREFLFDDLDEGTRFTWKARVEYEGNPFQRHGPWFGRAVTTPGLAMLSTDADTDGDGVPSFVDCNDADGELWATPGEPERLRFLADKVTLEWDPPEDPGGDVGRLRYDLLRADRPDGFESATCLESDDTDLEARDEDVPGAGEFLYYLVRAENDCRHGQGSLGWTSWGDERRGRDCP